MAPLTVPDPALLGRFAAIVGPAHALADPDAQTPYLREWRDRYLGRSPLVLRPGSTAEVAAILKLADESRVGIVPQGGNTGLVGGQIPLDGASLVLSLKRLNRVRSLDPAGDAVTVEAGATLAEVQAAAESVDRLFPLSLAAEAQATIGGNLATNAGGTGVIAYGSARALTLGVEAVLAGGRIVDLLSPLRKDNTGYDLTSLLVGSEGTLGVVTAATLRLHPRPRAVATAFAGLTSPQAALDLLALARAEGGFVTAFEFMPRIGLKMVLDHVAGARDPFGATHPWYVLIEFASQNPAGFREGVEAMLARALERGLVSDAALAESAGQAAALWRLRESMSEAQKHEGGSIKHDVAVSVADVPRFLSEATAAVEAALPGARVVAFGHLGDGNVHFNVSQPKAMDAQAFLARWDEIGDLVHGIVARFRGSISAEHGIGRMKRDLLARTKPPEALAAMRAIKAALDPNGILNPGAVL